jgi:N-acyl-D-aspartate/D-glutamate deacylase
VHVLILVLLLVSAIDVRNDGSAFLIRGATVYDGSAQPGREADVLIQGKQVKEIGKDLAAGGKVRIIDGAGLIVAPGFIDLHTHSDTPLTQKNTRANLCYLMQGVTTVVTGNCGFGPSDVAGYFRTLEAGGIGSNVIHQVPHNDVRNRAMGNANRLPTSAELKKMEAIVDRGMKDGAWGLATGLIYNPGTYSKTDELIALARVAARHGGFYASHIRNEGTGVLAAIDEALRIGREAGLPVHISHLKASCRQVWGKSAEIVALVQQARAGGQAATADQYPYTASSTSLAATLIPPRFREGTPQDFLVRLNDPDQVRRLRRSIEAALQGREEGKAIRIARFAPRPAWQGKSLADIAYAEKRPLVDLVLEIERRGGAAIVNFGMNEEDVRLIMKQPFVATASDGSSQFPSDTVPHPRSYGCFARKIGHYAIEEKLLTVEQAIRSASGLPADILKLPQRGYLRPGYVADVVVFDPKTYRDRATYDKPHQYATGVRYLFINGKLVIDVGRYTSALAGRVLRHSSKP